MVMKTFLSKSRSPPSRIYTLPRRRRSAVTGDQSARPLHFAFMQGTPGSGPGFLRVLGCWVSGLGLRVQGVRGFKGLGFWVIWSFRSFRVSSFSSLELQGSGFEGLRVSMTALSLSIYIYIFFLSFIIFVCCFFFFLAAVWFPWRTS